jgi:hypothetical protein
MGFELAGAILRAFTGPAPAGFLSAVPVNAGLIVLPHDGMCGDQVEALSPNLAQDLPFDLLDARGLAVVLRESAAAPCLWVEGEFFGGVGSWSVAGFVDGRVALPYLRTDHPTDGGQDRWPSWSRRRGRGHDDSAINAGLRWLGVTRSGDKDEFTVVGLHSRRHWNDPDDGE